MNTTAPPIFTAWLRRPHALWRQVASGPDEAAVRHQLAVESAKYMHVDTLVTSDGNDPNIRRPRR